MNCFRINIKGYVFCKYDFAVAVQGKCEILGKKQNPGSFGRGVPRRPSNPDPVLPQKSFFRCPV